jgi:peptide deformylase
MAAFCTLDTSKKNPEKRSIVDQEIMINPKVISISSEKQIDEE